MLWTIHTEQIIHESYYCLSVQFDASQDKTVLFITQQLTWHTGTVKGNTAAAASCLAQQSGGRRVKIALWALFQAALQCQQSAPTGQKGQQAAVEQSRREETIPLVEQARSRSAVANQRPTVSCSQVSHHLFCPPLSFDQVLCFASTLALWVIFGIWTKKWTPCDVRENPRKSKPIWSNVFHNQ